MPKKKTVVSGYTILMQELQQKYASEGRHIPLREIQKLAEPKMTEVEKLDYNTRAKARKKESQREGKKLASDGTSVEENKEQELEAEIHRREMLKDIQQFIGSYQELSGFEESVVRQHIYIISTNIMVATEEGCYIPIEIGIAQYSIKEGVLRSFHRIISPGPAPAGYAGQAKEHSEETHKFPCGSDLRKLGESDIRLLWTDIYQFLSFQSGELPPLFCLSDLLDQTNGCFSWILSKTGNHSELRIWDLALLLFEMRRNLGAHSQIVSANIALEMLKKNTFDYQPDTRCEFHEDQDSAFCALGSAKRLCFLMSDCLCSVFNIDPTEKHLPPAIANGKGYELYIPSQAAASREFLEKEIPERMASRAAARSAKASEASSRITGLDELESFSDDEDAGSSYPYSASSTSITSQVSRISLGHNSGNYDAESNPRQPRIPPSALGQLRLQIDPTIGKEVKQFSTPGQGLGRGRPRMN